MKKAFKYLIPALVALLCSYGEANGAKPVAGHVILIGSDGFSSEVVRNNPGAFSNIGRLMREGSYTLLRRSVLPSSSAVNWASMFMGAGPELHGYTKWDSGTPDLPSRVVTENGLFPDIMYLIRGMYPEAETGCGYTWPTIGRLYERSAVSYNYRSATEAGLCETMCFYIEEKKPVMTMIVFDEPDATGHSFGWESGKFLERCMEIDGYVGEILSAAVKSGMGDDLIVIFTSDHGGIGKGHGGKTMDEMEAPFVIWGKGIKKGFDIPESVMVFDTAATIAHIFGIEPPQVWTGRPVMSVFE